MTKAQVIVHLKAGISDPEGSNTEKALHLLGFDAVKSVHTTRIWEIDLGDTSKAEAQEQVDRMCRRLLTNPVIHDYTIELSE
jgi:phosphoribosylformylglycinamidine synthase PurS subunit